MNDRPAKHDPAQALAEGLAHQVQRWALARCGDAPAASGAANAARQLSLATSDGHVCLPLAALGDEPAALRLQLLASGVVGHTDDPAAMPLVLDSDDRLYLHRHFDQERRLAQRLMCAASACASAPGGSAGAPGPGPCSSPFHSEKPSCVCLPFPSLPAWPLR